jgi:hypothetical protein
MKLELDVWSMASSRDHLDAVVVIIRGTTRRASEPRRFRDGVRATQGWRCRTDFKQYQVLRQNPFWRAAASNPLRLRHTRS